MAGGKLSDGIIHRAGAYTPGWMSNLGLNYDAALGELTIAGANGSDVSPFTSNPLTPDNPGWVTVPYVAATSNGRGRFIPLKITANATLRDDASSASHMTNLGWGITETMDWAEDVPFFLYVVNRANTNIDATNGNSKFFIAKNPCMKTTPSSANDIGSHSAIPVNDSQLVILILGTVTVANYVSLPCQLVGAIRMRWSTASDDWTIQGFDYADGFGEGQLRKMFAKTWTMPMGQMGANFTTYFLPNGGVPPLFTDNFYAYMLNPDGNCDCVIAVSGDGGSDGVGAVTAYIALPYVQAFNPGSAVSQGVADVYSAVTSSQEVYFKIQQGSMYMEEAAGTIMENGDFLNGARYVLGRVRFKAFAS